MQADPQGNVTFQIPERTLTGSREHVLEELDEMVETLLAVRQVVASKNGSGVRQDLPQTGTLPTAR